MEEEEVVLFIFYFFMLYFVLVSVFSSIVCHGFGNLCLTNEFVCLFSIFIFFLAPKGFIILSYMLFLQQIILGTERTTWWINKYAATSIKDGIIDYVRDA